MARPPRPCWTPALSHDAIPGLRRHRGVRRYSRIPGTNACADCARPLSRLRMPAGSARAFLSRDDPGRPDRRPDTGAGADALVAVLVSCNGRCMDRVLAAGAEAGLA